MEANSGNEYGGFMAKRQGSKQTNSRAGDGHSTVISRLDKGTSGGGNQRLSN